MSPSSERKRAGASKMISRLLSLTIVALLFTIAGPAAARDYLRVEAIDVLAEPADVAWKRLGDFCEVSELLDATCKIESGDGGPGTVRVLNGVTVETLVARTPHSYTYSQVEGSRAGTDYHGTIAVEPISKHRSRVIYTLVIDRSRLPAGTNTADYEKQLQERFQGAVNRAKVLIERHS